MSDVQPKDADVGDASGPGARAGTEPARAVSALRASPPIAEPERIALPGSIWVCGACGKTSQDRYGIEGERDHGWDESCMLNATLCYDDSLWRSTNTLRVLKAEAVQFAQGIEAGWPRPEGARGEAREPGPEGMRHND